VVVSKARTMPAALLLCALLAACGTVPQSPSLPPTPAGSSPESPGTSPGLVQPIAPGTQCGATAAFGGPGVAPRLPSPTDQGSPPTWSARAATLAITSVAASPDGGVLAIAGSTESSRTVQLWLADRSQSTQLDDGGAAVTCLAWSPDGSLVAGASRTGDVRLWDRHGQLVRRLHEVDPVFSLAWSPDGAVLATGAIHFPDPSATGNVPLPGIVRLWSRGGDLTRTLGTELTGGKFLNLAWSPDGSELAAGAMDYKVWRADGTQVGVPRTGGTPAWAMAWAPDGSALAIGDEDGTLQVVGPDGTVLTNGAFSSGVNAVTYSPDGASLAVGASATVSVVKGTDARNVLWSTAAGSAYATWSPDGRALLISRGDGLALVGASGTPSASLIGCPGNVSAFSWVGAAAVAATDSGWLCSWRPPSA
jgi:Tol biopolymer transport system component